MKKKIAILGGGIGAMTTAFELTNEKDWKEKYEITVYQLGWRLGGKGASGRNEGKANRIQEHGLHVFMGFYDNAFDVVKSLYEEAARDNLTPDSPFPTVDKAFSQLSTVVLTDPAGDTFELWTQQWPETSEFPGAGPPLAGNVKPFILKLIHLTANTILEAIPAPEPLRTVLLNTARILADKGLISGIASSVVHIAAGLSNFLNKTLGMTRLARLIHPAASGTLGMGTASKTAEAAQQEARLSSARTRAQTELDRPSQGADMPDEDLRQLLHDVEQIGPFVLRAIRGLVGELNLETRKKIIVADLALTMARGMFADGLLDGDFAKIEDTDLSEWLRKHGSLYEGRDTLTRSLYDAVFAYENGDKNRPRLGAGTGVYAALRLAFTHRGAIMWRMNAGMGDAIFTPFFKVLENRGVKFEFFQKVTNLGLSADKKRIERIEIDVQAELKAGKNGIYDPLTQVTTNFDGVARILSCWPDRPRYDQLVQGEEMKSASLVNPDIESYWTDWSPTPPIKRILEFGQDKQFDIVVLGISLGALPFICKELIAQPDTPRSTLNFEALQAWQAMVNNIKTVRTQGLQLWLKRTAGDMGFVLDPKFTSRPLLCGFVEPFDTWCDMTHLIPAENVVPLPQQIAYFCNSAPADPAPPDFSLHDYPAKQTRAVLSEADKFLDTHSRTIWQKGQDPLNPAKFDRSHVIDDYFRLNVDPPEQYVLSVPGSRRSRLKPGDSKFENLVLAGDWTRSILDLGCVEGAVISGKFAAAAISGKKAEIFGMIGAKWEEM